MKQKINLLIGLSTIVLIALAIMQYYLVKTSYDYKVEQFHNEVQQKIGLITNDFNDIDSPIFNKKDALYKQLADNYIADRKYRFQLKKDLLTNPYRQFLTHQLQLKLKKEFPETTVDFAVVANKFVMYNKLQKTDTIFSEKPVITNVIYGNLSTLENAFSVRNYVGTTSGLKDGNYKFLTEETLFVSVTNWEIIVWRRMATLLIVSIFCMLILISLFVVAIQSLIKQKKISDIKTDFINNITHELKTPLTTLSVATKILERKEVKENEVVFNSIVETINRQNSRLQNIIDQVMSNALGQEEIELQKETVTPDILLKTIIDDFKLSNPDIGIISNLNASKTSLNLDKFHLTTAINNVMENAVKYGCKNIILKTVVQNKQLNISIEDDGIGIQKTKQLLLFEKFYRVEEGNIHNVKGLGLGLYYVNQIIKAHQGSIKVQSDLGKGSLFTISIPSF